MLQLPHANILVIDDNIENLQLFCDLLRTHGYEARPVPRGELALAAAKSDPPDLVLLDVNMPEMDGYEVCARLKADPELAEIPVIFVSAQHEPFSKVKAFASGGVDYVTKPIQFEELGARVGVHLKLRRLQFQLEQHNHQLQELVAEQVREIAESHIATTVAVASLAEHRDEDTGKHIMRVQTYCRVLAQYLADHDAFPGEIDEIFVENIFHASALHDIGKVGVPDAILLKSGGLTSKEFEIMKTHCEIGAQTLAGVAARYPNNRLVRMGMEIAGSHHERWDGTGYPAGICGEAIPLSARIVTIVDQYDALRSKRPYKPAFDADRTLSILMNGDGRTMPQHFDSRILAAFRCIAAEFDRFYEEIRTPESGGGN